MAFPQYKHTHSSKFQDSAKHIIPQDQKRLPVGPSKTQQQKVQLQMALAVTAVHVSTPGRQKKEYLKKSKKNCSVQNVEKPQLANIPREAKAPLLYED